MKKVLMAFWLSMFLVVSLAGTSFSQQASLDKILQIERKIWTAIQTKKLDDALPHLDKTYTAFESAAQRRFDSVETHKRFLLDVLKDNIIDRWKILDPKLQDYGNTAVLTYLGHDSGKNQDEPYEHIWKVTAVYVKRTSGWKIAHYHWSLVSEQ